MHICAISGGLALPESTIGGTDKDMIDTHRTGIGEHVMHHIAVHLESGLFEGDRVKRRLAPILALLVEHVRRGTDRGALGEAFRIPPHIGSCRMHADGHIRDDADLHTGLAAACCAACN